MHIPNSAPFNSSEALGFVLPLTDLQHGNILVYPVSRRLESASIFCKRHLVNMLHVYTHPALPCTLLASQYLYPSICSCTPYCAPWCLQVVSSVAVGLCTVSFSSLLVGVSLSVTRTPQHCPGYSGCYALRHTVFWPFYSSYSTSKNERDRGQILPR